MFSLSNLKKLGLCFFNHCSFEFCLIVFFFPLGNITKALGMVRVLSWFIYFFVFSDECMDLEYAIMAFLFYIDMRAEN